MSGYSSVAVGRQIYQVVTYEMVSAAAEVLRTHPGLDIPQGWGESLAEEMLQLAAQVGIVESKMIGTENIPPGSATKQHPFYGEVIVLSPPFDLGGQKAVWVLARHDDRTLPIPARILVVLGDLT
jgi:hypothetical protein